jgi:hypothetical protein
MASQKGGASFGLIIGLILSIFVNIGLCYTTFTNNSAFYQKAEEVKQAKASEDEAVKRETEARAELSRIYQFVHGSTKPVDIERGKQDYLKVAFQKRIEILSQEQLSSDLFAKDLNKDGKVADKKDKEYTCLFDMYGDLFVELGAVIPELNRLRLEKGAALNDLSAARETAKKEKSEVDGQLATSRKETAEINEKLLADAKTFDSEKRRLEGDKEAALKEVAKKDEEKALSDARLESSISELKGRIAELTAKKQKTLVDTEADGEIVHADQRLGLAWINLGTNHRLRRGTIFDVYQYVKGGVKKSKGKVEVKAIDEDTAQVAILNQTDPSDPIVKGDYIASPFFDVKKEMHFVFVGEKPSARSRYTLDELVRRIQEHGGVVDKTVTIDTDFMIAIEKAEEDDRFQLGVQFGVTIMREAELLEYLGR